MKRKKLHTRVKHFLVPHKGNRYRPGIFTRQSVAAIALALLLIEGAYLVQVKVILQNTGFTAAVLPSALTSLTNADRSAFALPTLEEDPQLSIAAQAKADDMAQKRYFAHISPEGRTFQTHLKEVGYSYTYAGENLAVDFSESIDVENAWMNSPTHRANILKAEYTHVGYGVARGLYQGKEVMFVAQFFAAKKGAVPQAVAAATQVERDVPAEEPIAAINPDTREGTQVLGEEVLPPEPSGSESMAVLATSPSKVVWYMLTAFTALVAVLFSITIIAHIRNKYLYMEVFTGGFIILAVGLGILSYNGVAQERGVVPDTGQAASVSAAF